MRSLILVAAYLRASSTKQDTSVPEQRKQLKDFAEANGFQIIAWYVDDGKSGSRDPDKRTDFMRLLADAPTAEWKIVICLDISRFGRLDTIEGAFAKKALRDAKVSLHTILDGEIDWNSTTGRIVDAVLSEAQHDYSVRLGQKTLQGKLRAFLEGEPFGYKTPYGFVRKVTDPQGNERIVPRTEKFTKPKGWKGKLVEGDRQEVEIVRWLFDTFLKRDVGFRWLASDLNKRKIPSPTGKKWCGKVIQEMLENEKYCGHTTLGERQAGAFWRLNGDVVVEATTKAVIREGEPLIARDTHDSLVDPAVFKGVKAKVERRKASHSHSKGIGGYVLKDVLFCGECGRPLYGNPNGRGKSDSKKCGRTIYVCKTAIKYGKQCECGQWSVKEDEVLPFLKKSVVELGTDVLTESSVIRELKESPNEPDELRKQLELLSKKIEQGTERFLTAPAELTADLTEKLLEWKAERERLEAAIQQASQNEQEDTDRLSDLLKAMEGELLHVPEHKGKQVTIAVPMRRDTFRELLLSSGVRLDFWWKRNSPNRWKVCKVRVRIFGKVELFESIALLIV